MDNRPSSHSPLVGPLWIIAIALLIIAMGLTFVAYLSYERHKAAQVKPPEPLVQPQDVELPTNTTTPRKAAMLATRPTSRATNTIVSEPQRKPGSVQVVSKPAAPPPPPAPPPDFFGIAPQGSGTARVVTNTIFGRVTLRGTPPPEKPIVMDPGCGRFQTNGAPTTRFYAVGADSELADGLVYLRERPPGVSFAPPRDPVVIDQIACQYIPYVTAARTNQRISVRNRDPLLHSIHPTPIIAGNPESNMAQLPNGADIVYRFPKPELFLRFKCDVHPWMFCYVSTLDHPYFSVSNEKGEFAMSLPPPGRYAIEVIHRKAGRIMKEIVVEANRGIQLDFELEVPSENP